MLDRPVDRTTAAMAEVVSRSLRESAREMMLFRSALTGAHSMDRTLYSMAGKYGSVGAWQRSDDEKLESVVYLLRRDLCQLIWAAELRWPRLARAQSLVDRLDEPLREVARLAAGRLLGAHGDSYEMLNFAVLRTAHLLHTLAGRPSSARSRLIHWWYGPPA